MKRWLRLRFEAPIGSFGGEAIDARGPTADFPTQSMLTGLFANALGWTRAMREEHQRLQDRLVYGALREHEPVLGRLTDYQTVQLGATDRAWTTRGRPVGRDGGPKTYLGTHQRWRDYHADLRVRAVVRFEPAGASPTIDEVAVALQHPARPLFIGRKACLPATPIFDGWVEAAADVPGALRRVLPPGTQRVRAQWPAAEGRQGASRVMTTTDERNWLSGLHGGGRHVCEGELALSEEDP